MKFALCTLFLALGLMAQSPANSIAGKWHLVELSDDEVVVPRHRVDFVFRTKGTVLSGAVINRNTGEDIPLANIRIDGNVLTVRLADSKGKPGTAVLTLTASGD